MSTVKSASEASAYLDCLDEIQEQLDEIKSLIEAAQDEGKEHAINNPHYMCGWYSSTLDGIKERIRGIEDLKNEHK